jgi:hypothetical protein
LTNYSIRYAVNPNLLLWGDLVIVLWNDIFAIVGISRHHHKELDSHTEQVWSEGG